MARISFRQGIVRDHQGGSSFLSFNGNFIQLNATTAEPVQVAFAHGPKDYLHTERQTVPEAWGPFVTGDHWLYWEINRADGTRTFGSTDKEPIEQAQAPSSPTQGQMWFDTTTTEWKEWSGSSWVVKVRVFAAKLSNNSVFDSMSINAGQGDFKGTQVGLTTSVRAGALVFDSGSPIFDSQGRFLTTEDEISSGLSSTRVRIDNIVKTATAETTLSPYQVVKLSGPNRVTTATVSDQGQKVLGLTDEAVVSGDVVDFVTEGIIFNSDWNWTQAGLSVNDPVFINNQGAITDTPQSIDQQPIGVVMDAQTIMFAPRLFPQVEADADVALANLTQSGAVDTQAMAWNNAVTQWEPASTLKTVGGPVIGDADNATSLRMRGNRHADEGGGKVQSYMGIFYNDLWDTTGTLKTRAIYGGNPEMDVSVQSPHQLQLVGLDATQTDGQIYMASQNDVVINTRAGLEVDSPAQLIIDRTDKGTTGTNNTSDVELSVSSGVLQIANDTTVNGTLVGHNDNGTSLRMSGEQSPNEGSNDVTSYMGIFHNPGFTNVGMLETRAIFGANAEMDMVLQSPNQLQVVASDSNTGNGQIWMTSRSDVVINAREEAEGIANKQLIVDRVDAGTVGVGNTSDVQLSVSSGTLQVASDVDFNNSVTIQGNLNVTGTTTTINTQDLTVSDNVVVLNSDVTGTPASSQDAGIEVERGTSDNASILWDETSDSWKVGISGSETEISVVGHIHDTSDVTSGTFADARIAQSNVTQHESALTITESQISDLGAYITASSTDTLTNKTFDANGTGNSISNIETADLAGSAKTGLDTQVVTGTAGVSGNLVEWNTDGDAVDSTIMSSNVLTDITNESLNDLSDVNASTPSEDQALVYNGTEWTAQNPENWMGPVTASTTLTGTGSNVIADTTGGAITITLPSSPSNGWSFKFVDLTTSWATNNLTIDADSTNTNTIEGGATSIQSTSDSMIEVIFLNGDWKVRTLA